MPIPLFRNISWLLCLWFSIQSLHIGLHAVFASIAMYAAWRFAPHSMTAILARLKLS
ncbi:hypothetical protein D3C81_2213150 [compost metagenome]